jgi:hypothetical protein
MSLSFIYLCLVLGPMLLGSILAIVSRSRVMTEADYELYFRTHIMGMTVSNLLTPEVQQMLAQRLAPPPRQEIDAEFETWSNFMKYVEDDQEKL